MEPRHLADNAPTSNDARPADTGPSLEDAIVFPTIPVEPIQTWRLQQLGGRRGVDYVAVLQTERTVSHHPYLYERRRSGNWVADVWRNGDGSNEEISYFNTRTGASVNVRRNDAGQIVAVSIAQSEDYSFDQRKRTGEFSTFLGRRCEIWRTIRRPPGSQVLNESCVTRDGIELWSQVLFVGHPTHPDTVSRRVEVSSLSVGRVASHLARPPREVFDWRFWRSQATNDNAPVPNAPPEHSVWFEEARSPERGRVIFAQYGGGKRSEASHFWWERGSEYDYRYDGGGLQVRASVNSGMHVGRSVEISLVSSRQAWRPDAETVSSTRAPQVILGRQCNWLDPRNPPADISWSDCWTNDNLVLARSRGSRGSGYSVNAVKLETGAPREPIDLPPEIFGWARQMSE